MKSTRRDERGQVLVIFAGAVVVLLAIAALVIDVGMIFVIRRNEQNAADPGAVAAARYIPTGDRAQMWTAACFYATQNGFMAVRTDNGGACHPSGMTDTSTVTVNHPPRISAGEYAGDPGYVEVVVSRRHQSFFAGAVGRTSFDVSTNAVAAFDEDTGGASSLVALDPDDCGAAKINGGGGDGGIYIFPAPGVSEPGGFIQVNSICGAASAGDDTCFGSSTGGLIMNGGAALHAPALFVQGGCGRTGASGTMNVPVIDEGAPYVGDPLALIRPPAPGDLATMPCPGQPSNKWGTPTNPQTCDINGTVTLSPGTYYGGWKIGNGTNITLNPGIYIMAGGGISQTGGVLSSANGRVLIYGTDAPQFRTVCLAGGGSPSQCQGDLDVRGTGTLDLKGLDRTQPCPPYSSAAGCPYGGMLLWQDGTGSGVNGGRADIEIGGGSTLDIEGTIYSAGGHVEVLGNGATNGCSTGLNCASIQIIANTFQVGGAGILEMPYDPNDFYQLRLKGLVK